MGMLGVFSVIISGMVVSYDQKYGPIGIVFALMAPRQETGWERKALKLSEERTKVAYDISTHYQGTAGDERLNCPDRKTLVPRPNDSSTPPGPRRHSTQR
jgi:hypothetical protein